jgi:tetratricopeptide (TPR) repeat protein
LKKLLVLPAVAAAVLALLAVAPPLSASPGLDDREAQAHLEEMGERGVLRDPLWAQAYYSRASKAPTESARLSDLRWALEFDPDLLGARWDLVVLEAKKLDPACATEALRGLLTILNSFGAQRSIVRNVLVVGGSALLLTLLALSMLVFARALPRISHGLRERLHFLPPEARTGAVLLTLLSPSALLFALSPGAAIFWAIAIATVGAWTVMSSTERRTAIAALVGLAAAPILFVAGSHLEEPSLPDSYLGVLSSSQAEARPSGSASTPWPPAAALEDPDHFATLALLDRRARRYAEARHSLARSIELDGRRWFYHNNLGNLKLLQGDAAGALESYRTAALIAPREPTIYANEAQAWLSQLEFKKADDSFQRAASLGHHLASHRGETSGAILVEDWNLGPLDLWQRFGRFEYHETALSSRRILSMVVSFILPFEPFWIALLLFGALLYAGVAARLPRASQCAGCGHLVCRKCHYRLHRKSYCAPCYAIHQEVRAPLKRDEMLLERRRLAQRGSRIAGIAVSVVLPGSGHWMTGSLARGTLMLAGAFVILVAMARARLWPDPLPEVVVGRSIMDLAFPVVAFALLSTFSLLGALRRASHEREVETDSGAERE